MQAVPKEFSAERESQGSPVCRKVAPANGSGRAFLVGVETGERAKAQKDEEGRGFTSQPS
jgi:hypothetical protein